MLYFPLLCSTWTIVLRKVVNGNVQSWSSCISICITFRYSSFRTSQRALHTSFIVILIVHAGIRNKYCRLRYKSPGTYNYFIKNGKSSEPICNYNDSELTFVFISCLLPEIEVLLSPFPPLKLRFSWLYPACQSRGPACSQGSELPHLTFL